MASITLRAGGDAQNEKVGIDWWMLGSAALLIFIGLGAIVSSNKGSEVFGSQLKFVVMGLVPAAIFGFSHPRLWAKLVNWIYLGNILALVLVLAVGKTTKGAERWIELGPFGRLQPSELSKILIVLSLATFYSMRQDRIKEFSTFFLSLCHILVPAVLIYRQPHLGATLLVLTIWVAMSLVAGVPPKFMAAIVGLLCLTSALVLTVPVVRNNLLKPYQIERVEGLLGIKRKTSNLGKSEQREAEKELRDKQLQQEMAEKALGNGGIAGTGYNRGEQKSKVPEQRTDFIFSLIGEEFGFLGSLAVLGLFGVFFYRIWLGMLNAADFYTQMVMGGILTIFAFHLFVNLGMVLRLLPVVGMWSPFLSYGGTAIWLCMSLVALALNIRSKERAVLF